MGLQKVSSTGKGGNQAPHQLGMWVASTRVVVKVSEGSLILGLSMERGMNASFSLSSSLAPATPSPSMYR